MYRWDRLILFISAINLLSTTTAVTPPSIRITPTENLFPHWLTTFTLHCNVTDWPGSPAFFWKRDRATLYPNADSKITFSEDKQSIIFTDVTQQQSGEYFCVAAEFMEYLFESSQPVQIAVQEPPLIPINLTVIAKTSTTLHLRWEPQGDIPAEYYTLVRKPGDHQYTADQHEAVISQLDPYSIYSFAVSAHNKVGTRGKSSALQTRTEPGPPSGVLDFNVGIRTSDSLEVEWNQPESGIVNDILTGYELMVHETQANSLVLSQNFTTNVTKALVSGLLPETQYTLSMAFRTRCCVSDYVSLDSVTMSEGKTFAPTDAPRTEGNTASETLSSGAIAGISLGCGLLVVILIVILLYFRCKAPGPLITAIGGKPINSWNDGTENGANDLIPVSPPPQYSPLSHTQQPSEAASGNVQDATLSRSFRYDAVNATSPPPAYHSRTSSNNDNSSISDLSNVDATESLEVKEMNIPTLTTSPPRQPNTPIYSVPHTGVSSSDPLYTGSQRYPSRGTYI